MFDWLRKLEAARRRMNVDAVTVQLAAFDAARHVLPRGQWDWDLIEAWRRIPSTEQFSIMENVREQAVEKVTKLLCDRLSAEIGADERLTAMRDALKEADAEFKKRVDSVTAEIENATAYILAALQDNGHTAMAQRVRKDIDRALGLIQEPRHD